MKSKLFLLAALMSLSSCDGQKSNAPSSPPESPKPPPSEPEIEKKERVAAPIADVLSRPPLPKYKPDENAPPAPPMPEDFCISAGGGGGAAGRYESFEIEASGAVIRRASEMGPNMGELAGRVEVETVRALWALSQQIGLEKIPSRYDNMTQSISLTAQGKTIHVARPDQVMQRDPQPGDASAEQSAAFFHLLHSVESLASSRKAVPAQAGPILVSARVRPVWTAGKKSYELTTTIKNGGAATLRVPSGRSQAGFMNDPFGAELALSDEKGSFQADPGAGGPALPIGAEHWKSLKPGESLELKIDIGAWIRVDEKGAKVALSKTPGRYVLKLRWQTPEGVQVEGEPGVEVWRGRSDFVEMRVFVDKDD